MGMLRCSISQNPKVRHRPLHAGDPIFFLVAKMGCPDKPGNDDIGRDCAT
jgi:hypothetical protein